MIKKSRDSRALITLKDSKSPISEAYRTLRTNIQFSNIDKDLKTIIFTSAIPQEGKSSTVANLAVSMAQAGKKVVLIDCDLRKPTLHERFKISNIYGLTNVLVGEKGIYQVIQFPEEIENLSMITSGPIPPNPAELLDSRKMETILDELKEKVDIILIDTPPIGIVTDAAVLSTKVDGVILVVGYKQAEIEMVQSAQSLLNKVGANIIGTVLTQIDIKDRSYSKYGSYGYYGETQKQADNRKKKRAGRG